MAKKYQAIINVEEGMIAPIKDGNEYGEITEMGGLQTAQRAVTLATAQVHGDGEQLDEINEIVNNTVTETTAGESDEVLAMINGHKIEGGETIIGTGDAPPFVGHAYVEKVRGANVGNGTSVQGYRGRFYPRGKFAPAGETATAKTGSITPSTSQLVFTAFPNENGRISTHKLFTGLNARADAIAYCKAKFTTPVAPAGITAAKAGAK